MNSFIFRRREALISAVRDAFGYRGRGTASPVGDHRAIFDRHRYGALEEREVGTPTGEAVPPRV